MSKEQARQSELKKMELCDSVRRHPAQLAPRAGPRGAGAARQPQGRARRRAWSPSPRYECDRCGTAWEYENDKANLHAGWSVVGR